MPLMLLLKNRFVLGGIGVLVLLFVVWRWYDGKIDAAHQQGYETRQSEITIAHQQIVAELTAENSRLRSADNVRVETVIQERVRTERVIEYVEREIPVVDVSHCSRLSADWVRVYNAAARADCGAAEDPADCGLAEAAVSGAGPYSVR